MKKKETGSVLLASFLLMIIVSTTLLSLLSQINTMQRITQYRLIKMKAYYAAVSGLAIAVNNMDNLPITDVPPDKDLLYQNTLRTPDFTLSQNTNIYFVRTPDIIYSIGIAANLGRSIIQAQYTKLGNQYKITHWQTL